MPQFEFTYQPPLSFDAAPHNLRLDKFLAQQFPLYPRTALQTAIKSGAVTVNSRIITKQDYRLTSGDQINIDSDHLQQSSKIAQLSPSNTTSLPPLEPNHHLELTVVYDDEHLAIINKPPSMTVHPGANTNNDTLVNALIARYGTAGLSHSNTCRPGIVHRLDRNTTGLLLIAKNDQTHYTLTSALQRREISRNYLAIVHGNLGKKWGQINTMLCRDPADRTKMRVSQIAGKVAITNYRVIAELPGLSLLECRLETGRTHQIRVHLSWLGHPLLGDKTYSGGRKLSCHLPEPIKQAASIIDRQALHSYRLAFTHPLTSDRCDYTVPPPEDVLRLCRMLLAAAPSLPSTLLPVGSVI